MSRAPIPRDARAMRATWYNQACPFANTAASCGCQRSSRSRWRGHELVQRMRKWLGGRFRLTASFLSQLLKSDFKNPNLLLEQWIAYNTRFTPTDTTPGPKAVLEPFLKFDRSPTLQVRQTFRSTTPLYRELNFARIKKLPGMMELCVQAVYESLLRHHITTSLLANDGLLVECGFARYRDSPTDKSKCIMEPLVVLAAYGEIQEQRLGKTLDQFVMRDIGARRGSEANGWETYCAYRLVNALGQFQPLKTIFNFPSGSGVNLPDWLNQSARLVSTSRSSAGLTVHPVDWPNASVPSGQLGRSCSPQETMDWLANRDRAAAPFCFPDDNMGPDLLFILELEDQSLICVAMQMKFWQGKTLVNIPYPEKLNEKLREGLASIVPSKFWLQKKGRDETGKEWRTEGCPHLQQGTLTSLKNIPGPASLRTPYPLLRVLVTFPTFVPVDRMQDVDTDMDKDKHPLCAINWEYFRSLDLDDIIGELEAPVLQGKDPSTFPAHVPTKRRAARESEDAQSETDDDAHVDKKRSTGDQRLLNKRTGTSTARRSRPPTSSVRTAGLRAPDPQVGSSGLTRAQKNGLSASPGRSDSLAPSHRHRDRFSTGPPTPTRHSAGPWQTIQSLAMYTPPPNRRPSSSQRGQG
ncbi:hypothetical protein C8R46DRAFT_1030429 [Mycena filopes]|nr:hypothetical protein C8R46DRAFT_1030429 [Mycena filopes]